MVQGGLKKVQGGLSPPWHPTSRAYGLMLSAHNRKVLNSLLLKIDREFELLFSRTSLWPDSVNLPGTNVTKGTLKQSKLEFDDRVEEWFCSADKIAEALSVNGNSRKTDKNERLMKSRSKSSKNSVFTSTSSSLSLKEPVKAFCTFCEFIDPVPCSCYKKHIPSCFRSTGFPF